MQLLKAVEQDNLDTVKSLLAIGTSITSTDHQENNVFHLLASKEQPTAITLELFNLFINNIRAYSTSQSPNKEGKRPLHLLMENLSFDPEEKFPIYKRQLLIQFIKQRPYGFTFGENKETLLHFAIARADLELINLLLIDNIEATITKKNKLNQLPLTYASAALLKATDSQENNAFHMLARQQMSQFPLGLFDFLVQQQNYHHLIDAKNKEGKTPLQILMAHEYFMTRYYGREKRSLLIRFIEHGVHVNTTFGRENQTLLHFAVYMGDIDLVNLLLKHQADIHAKNKLYLRPIDYSSPIFLKDVNHYSKQIEDTTSPKYQQIQTLLMTQGSEPLSVELPSRADVSKIKTTFSEEDRALALSLKDLPSKKLDVLDEQCKKIDQLFARRDINVFYCVTPRDVNVIKGKMTHHDIFETDTIQEFTSLSILQLEHPKEYLLYHNLCTLLTEYNDLMIKSHKVFTNDTIIGKLKISIHNLNETKMREQKVKYSSLTLFSMPSFNGALRRLYGFEHLTEEELIPLKEFATIIRNKYLEVLDCLTELEMSLGERYRMIYVKDDQTANIQKKYSDSVLLTWPKDDYECTTVTTYRKFLPEEQAELDRLMSPISPLLQRNQLSWQLLQRQSNASAIKQYLKRFQRKSYVVGDDTLDFYDLTEADDYQFIVNTVISKPKPLTELEQGEPRFFEKTPFISCCVLDKATRAFAGGHQTNYLFPLYMALEVDPESIVYMGHTDIDSPYGCFPKSKLMYLNTVVSTRMKMDLRQAAYQEENSHLLEDKNYPASPHAVSRILKKDPQYHEQGVKCRGSVPFFTLPALLKKTCGRPKNENAYCELIVTGNTFNSSSKQLKGHLLIVDKYFLDKFNEEYLKDKKTSDVKSSINNSLAILKTLEAKTNGRLKLVLIQTDMKAYFQKLPVQEQVELLQKKQERRLIAYQKSLFSFHRMKQEGKEDKDVTQAYERDKERFEKTRDELLAYNLR